MVLAVNSFLGAGFEPIRQRLRSSYEFPADKGAHSAKSWQNKKNIKSKK